MEKILLVEDNASIIKGLTFYLKKEGYQIEVAKSAVEARKQIMNDIFDLIILDVGLPDGDGFEIGEEVRRMSQVPIIFLTARDEQEDIIKGLSIGADDYMTKPFSVKELHLRINSILKRSRKADAQMVKVSGDILIEITNNKAFRKGEMLDLTPTEYKLLNVFMDNPKLALNREDLLRQIWDTNESFQSANTITVYIKRLREKIEDNISEPVYITTVRKGGYMWDVEVFRR
ncbi:MAG: response regulator transcription factor [Tissierellia bacterium]|nr:response regulator transcription factor [Tissierellia bacterium]